ncbi:MAG: phosphoserine phosphatase SerB [Acidiferrobacterales bacterium]
MDLVIQGNGIQTQDLGKLAQLLGASAVEAISPQAFRFRGSSRSDRVADYCAHARLDYAYIPNDRKLANFGLLVMDMDSTLITIECIDEIADILGIKPKVAAVTAATMRGEIAFSESLQRRVALLAGIEESVLAHVYEQRLKITPGAERLLEKTKAAGLKTLLVTGGFTYFTERLKVRLGIDYVSSNTVEITGGRLTGRISGPMFSAQAKADQMRRVCKEIGLGKNQAIAIGDGANDLRMMADAGMSVAYKAKQIVGKRATHVLNHSGLDGVLNLFS